MLLCLLVCACGHSDRFVVHGQVQGLGEKGVEMTWCVNGVMQRAEAHAVDGKFSLAGIAPAPVLVEVATADREPLFTLVAENGDDIEVKMLMGQPATLQVSGSKPNEFVAKWLHDNDSLLGRGNDAAVNRAVARAVADNRSSLGAALLLVTQFRLPGHEMEADSLTRLLEAEATPQSLMGPWTQDVATQTAQSIHAPLGTMTLRTSRDSVVRLTPSQQSYALMAFTSLSRPDSVNQALRQLGKASRRGRFRVVEITLGGDSASWGRFVRGDSARRDQAWLPGGAAHPLVRQLSLPRTPYFVLIDSTGRQVYRGPSVSLLTRKTTSLGLGG